MRGLTFITGALLNQLLGAPESIQQMIEFFCAAVSVEFLGMNPVMMAVLILALAALISAWLVNAPGPLILPVLWQLLWLQTDEKMGNTSAVKLIAAPVQLGVKLLLPPPEPPPPLFLQDEMRMIDPTISITSNCFITFFFKLLKH